MVRSIEPDDLVIHFLNVGFGDNIVIQFPKDENGNRKYGLVDCTSSRKTLDYLRKLMRNDNAQITRLAFICATHPHYDHISGISRVMDSPYYPYEFWDSGFRHNSQTYIRILEHIIDKNVKMVRVSSGMEWYFNQVRITALSPSIRLRNRYATYGVDMNNASIVLRFEHNRENVITMQSKEYEGNTSVEAERRAGRSVVILAGDAEFDSWSHVCQEFPMVERTSAHKPLVKKMVNYLSSAVVKVAHHGSMHSTPLDVYEKIGPHTAIISTKQEESTKQLNNSAIDKIKRDMFPHQSATMALEECDAKVLTTDGSYEGQTRDDGSGKKDAANMYPGTIVAFVPPGGTVVCEKLNDRDFDLATPPPVTV